MVRNRHLINPELLPGDFGGEFRLKPKTIRTDANRLENFAREDLISCFHISHIQVIEHVCQQGQELISKRMPEEQDTMRATSKKTRAKHNICLPTEYRNKEMLVIGWIIFKIRILNDDDIPLCVTPTGLNRCSFPFVLFVKMLLDILPHNLPDPFPGSIR